MKPFDLEAAKRGEPIVTRDGRKAKFVAHVPEAYEAYSVIVFIEGNPATVSYSTRGTYTKEDHECDLFMAPPPMRSINGHEYPEPERKPLKNKQRYWVSMACEDDLTYLDGFLWNGGNADMVWLNRGLIHLTKEAAEAHAKAIILAGGGEV